MADVVLLPLCAGLTLLGVLATALAWRRGNRGRVVQGVGLVLAPTALYLSGLLGLLWRGLTALGTWVTSIVLSPVVWVGFVLLAVAVVLLVVGGMVAGRSAARRRVADGRTAGVEPARAGQQPKAVSGGRRPSRQQAAPAEPVDEDMAEIEAILKSRGIS